MPNFKQYPKKAGWDPIGLNLRLESISTLALMPSNFPQVVFKNGQTTGNTWDFANGIQSDVLLEGVVYSVVDIILPRSHLYDFYKYGDSGAIVLDKQGQLCGLLIGGRERDFG